MKKQAFAAMFIIVALLSLQAQEPPQQQKLKLEDVQKALCLVDKAQAAPDKYKAGLEAITAKDTMAMLTFVASDVMEGRETGTQGYQIAAEYAASLMKLFGVKPAGDTPVVMRGRFGMGGPGGGAPAAPPERTYFQDFGLKSVSDSQQSITIEVNNGGAVKTREFKSGLDYSAGMGRMGGGDPGTLTAPVVFIGYGINEPSIKWDELKGLNLKGKIVLMLSEAPGKTDPKSPFQTDKKLKDKYFPAGPQGEMMMMMPPGFGPARFNKTTEIAKLGPAAIAIVQNTGKDSDVFKSLSAVRKVNDERAIVNKPRLRLSVAGDSGGGMGMMGMPNVTTLSLTREMADMLLEGTGKTIDDMKKQIETTGKPASMDIAGAKLTITTTAKVGLVHGTNVIGYIEGSDPKLKNEYVVVGGHYDHLGKWEDYIYNGADDNGSGAVGVLNIAKAIAASPIKPKRTIVFALWTGEEEGLLGSRYYVQNPEFPIDKTVGYLNYDMISRPYDEATLARSVRQYADVPGAADLTKKIRAPWVVTVSATEKSGFTDLQREMNNYVGLDLIIRESPLGVGSGGSDHASFASVKVPFVYYMAAMTSDYHQTSDTADKTSGELLAKISQIGYMTVYAYADKDK